MSARNPWSTAASEVGYSSEHLRVHHDQVRFPDGRAGAYDWIETADQVRVAAIVDADLLLIEQHHYLVGRFLQLPGGSVDPPEGPGEAARRELAQETGFRGGSWDGRGFVHPLPGLSPVRIHLFAARGLEAGTADPEPSERDLRLVRLPLRKAVDAALAGTVTCAASVALILAIAGTP